MMENPLKTSTAFYMYLCDSDEANMDVSVSGAQRFLTIPTSGAPSA